MQRGLIKPSTTTVFHMCSAKHFNDQLPFRPVFEHTYNRNYSNEDGGYMSPVHDHPDDLTITFKDCNALHEYANLHFQTRTGFFYVVQIEIDLLVSDIRVGAVTVRAPNADSEMSGLTEMKEAVLIDGPVNPEAITRVWLASRASSDGTVGDFTNVHAPVGAFGS